MGELWLGHVTEVERGRNVATNQWKADGFLEAIADKYGDEDLTDVADLELEIERLQSLAAMDARWLRVLAAAEKALKDRAEHGAMIEE
jgi:hypothetical protein